MRTTLKRRALADLAIGTALALTCLLAFQWDRTVAKMEQTHRQQVRQLVVSMKAKPHDTVCFQGTCYKRPN